MLKRIFILVVVTILNSVNIGAQNSTIEYAKKITISDGLAHNGVSSILEDSKGFLWIGTYHGINKYDGIKLTTYKNTLI